MKLFTNLSRILKPAIIFIMLMWLIFFLEFISGQRWSVYGIYPRSIEGLKGIITSPFLHGDLSHLWSNTLPAFFLITALRFFYRMEALRVFLFGFVLTGLFTWVIGRNSFHIGASGIIYMLAAFLIFKGLIARKFKLVAVSFVILFFYGSMVWYILPIVKGMSWEGHLSGMIAGIILAFVIKVKSTPDKVYEWQSRSYTMDSDPFMKHFDGNGNFIEFNEEE